MSSTNSLERKDRGADMTDRIIKVVQTCRWQEQRLTEAVGGIKGINFVITDDKSVMLRELGDAEIIIAGELDQELLAAAPKCRWIQALTGGVTSFMFPELVTSDIEITCGKGLSHVAVAEHGLALMLILARKLDYDLHHRADRKYTDYMIEHQIELEDATIGIIGMGRIGSTLAKKARCLGMRTMGIDLQSGMTNEHFDHIFEPNELSDLLGEADFVAVCVPLTPQTEGLIGKAQLKSMKDSAYLIDCSGRNQIYDLDAVAKALKERWIRAAAMQLSPAPAAGSQLWELDNFIYCFHRGTSCQEDDRYIDRICENIRRYLAGDQLLGKVNKELGF